MRKYTGSEVLARLRNQAERPDITQLDLARNLGFSAQFINDVLGGRRGLTVALAESLGFRKVEFYVRKSAGEGEANEKL